MNSFSLNGCRPFGMVALTLCVLCGARSVAAQDTPVVTEKDFLDDMPIVLSVSRLPQRLDETPGAVTLIDRDFIRRSGARDVTDLLRWIPGFQVSSSFESGAPLASYHGAFNNYSNRLELLVDGRSVYSPYFIGSIGPGLQSVALEDIERIEVLRGSNSAAYGARAILGVINILTRHTVDSLGGQGALTLGENGVADAQARFGWGSHQATYRLTVDRRADEGLTGSNGHNQVNRVNFRSDWHPTGSDEIQLRLGDMVINAGAGFAGNIDNPSRDNRFETNFVQMDWRRSLNMDEDLILKVSSSQEDYQDRFPYALQPMGINDTYIVDASGRASSDVVSLQHTFRRGPVRVVWGGEFRSERVVSRGLYNTDAAYINDFTRLFGNVEWRISPALVSNVGAMVEKSSVTGESFSPRLMLNWHAAQGQTLRAGVTKAFRPPSNYEKFADVHFKYKNVFDIANTQASGHVDSETVTSREIGYFGEFPLRGLGLDVRIFHEQINGFIRQQNNLQPHDYVNEEDFAIHGIEYQAKWQPWPGTKFVFSQSYTDSDALMYRPLQPIKTYSGTPFASPQLASSLTYNQKLPGNLDLTLSHQDNGTAALTNAGAGNAVAMTRTDLRLAKAFRWGSQKGDLALVVQNLGLPYQDFDPRFTFERRAFVTLQLEN
jgi:iron complex outermembrane receptor protein